MRKPTTTNNKIRILVVDDHLVVRMGLMTSIGDAGDMEVVADVETGREALAAFRKHEPDVVILDLRMQGMNGLETLRTLREEAKNARVLIFSNYSRAEEIFQAMKNGASGFVAKEMPLQRLLEAIRAVYNGNQYLPPEIAMRLGGQVLSRLSSREMEVLQLLGRGLSNKEMGSQLGVVEGTVKIHITNIFCKLGVLDRTQALIEAIRRGIIQID